jgi:predicted permease
METQFFNVLRKGFLLGTGLGLVFAVLAIIFPLIGHLFMNGPVEALLKCGALTAAVCTGAATGTFAGTLGGLIMQH